MNIRVITIIYMFIRLSDTFSDYLATIKEVTINDIVPEYSGPSL